MFLYNWGVALPTWLLILTLFVLVPIFIVWLKNKHIIGLLSIVLGIFLNVVVVLANDGLMPVDPWMRLSYTDYYFDHKIHGKKYKLYDNNTRLVYLGDWIDRSWPIPGIASPGDLFMELEITLIIIQGSFYLVRKIRRAN